MWRGACWSRDVDVGAVVERIARATDVDGHPLTIECQPVSAAVDPVMVERIIENLWATRPKHTPEATPVSVHVGPSNGGVEIRVEDEGPGISDDLKPTIFERFRRGDTIAPGSGVGLSLVTWFVELHGGRGLGRRQVRRRSVFGVWLPTETPTPPA